MSESALVIIPLIITSFALVIACAVGCCCCCCALPLWRVLFPAKYSIVAEEHSHAMLAQQVSNERTPIGFLEVVDDSAQVPVVEAYIVPPLVAKQGDSAGHPQSRSSPLTEPRRFNDLWAALLFAANIVIVFALAINAYSQYKSATDPELSADALPSSQFSALAVFVVAMIAISSTICSAALYLMINNAARIIDWINWINIISFGAMTLFSLVTLQVIMAAVFGFMTLMAYWYYWSIQSRIPFASAVIGAACSAVRKNFVGLLTAAYSGLIVQACWILLWSVAMYGIFNDNNLQSSDGVGWVYFLMTLSVFWGLQVIHSVMSVTAGGAVASWWFMPQHPAPVRGALFRATTTSFGSICFGSLIVAFIQTLREFLRGVQRQEQRRRDRSNPVLLCVLCIASSILQVLEDALVYVNRFAYSYVAAYGYDFISAGKQVTSLFKDRGWTAIINDNLISNAFSIFAIGTAVVSALIGALLLPAVYAAGGLAVTDGSVVAGVLLGLVIGFVVGLIIISILDSAVAMVYVCFAEDPEALRSNHFDTYDLLIRSWELFNPQSLAWTHARVVESGAAPPLATANIVSPMHDYDSYQAPTHVSQPPYNPHYTPADTSKTRY